ncbi:P-II family nitrogen regulator [Paeniglutamicibacter sp. Y32M11]|uniref:P-II family nitrogen regulator n=1 Tax=Paeniglutamicibacter sp. Y32M11 TaxID=2853258 RepID=UPI00104AA1B8|nr:P-II family nitrogen regulator [Paeniglutamicibacter sp. Y32M11]QXQ10049.1 P-II family nitrogen regulator [Paeniglutamicibacter sp. Y32M11]
MKLITAIIKPIRVETVSKELEKAGFTGLSVSEMQGRGAQAGRMEYYRGQAFAVEFRTKMCIELLVAEKDVDKAIDVIVANARTGDAGAIGDGKVWVTPVDRVVRVRTGEEGEAAI